MKPRYVIVVFLTLLVVAIASSVHSYRYTEDGLLADMNQALKKTLDDKKDCWITPDTIADYRANLHSEALRERSIVYYAVNDRQKGLRSKKMTLQKDGRKVCFQSYANCSVATIWWLSDQRMTLLLMLAAVSWLALWFFKRRKSGIEDTRKCALAYSEAAHCFVNSRGERIDFTPMQEQLMMMFLRADGHRLSKQQICDELWPKKPDASDTLYTLIRRLKPVLRDAAEMTIVNYRGRDYQLTDS